MSEVSTIEAVSRYFQEIGLEPVDSNRFNMQWRGTFRGREVSVLFSRRSKAKFHGEHVRTRQYVGHQVVFETPLQIATRFSVTKDENNSKAAQKLRSLVSLEAFEMRGSSSNKLFAYTCDPEWAKEFASDEDVLKVLDREFISPADSNDCVFGLFPGVDSPGTATFTCRMPLSSITEKMCSSTLESLVTLADASEKYAPRIVVSISRIERIFKTRPLVLFFGLLACIVLLGLLFSATLIAVVLSGVTPLVMPVLLFIMYLLYRRYFK